MNATDRLSLVLSDLWLSAPGDLGRFFSSLILYTAGRTPWTGDQPIARLLPTHKTQTEYTHTDINASSRIRTHDPSVRSKEDDSRLDGAATGIGTSF
jgi:hypothetical protein